MKGRLLTVGIVALFGVAGIAHAAGDAQAGKVKSSACVGCHGKDGQGVGKMPALAGLSEAQFTQAMKDFKSGKVANPTMKMMAGPLKDQDIANLAAYYASLKKK